MFRKNTGLGSQHREGSGRGDRGPRAALRGAHAVPRLDYPTVRPFLPSNRTPSLSHRVAPSLTLLPTGGGGGGEEGESWKVHI